MLSKYESLLTHKHNVKVERTRIDNSVIKAAIKDTLKTVTESGQERARLEAAHENFVYSVTSLDGENIPTPSDSNIDLIHAPIEFSKSESIDFSLAVERSTPFHIKSFKPKVGLIRTLLQNNISPEPGN